jgi:hypothetical protein
MAEITLAGFEPHSMSSGKTMVETHLKIVSEARLATRVQLHGRKPSSACRRGPKNIHLSFVGKSLAAIQSFCLANRLGVKLENPPNPPNSSGQLTSTDHLQDPERDGQFDAPGSRRGRGSWTKLKADRIKEWFTR